MDISKEGFENAKNESCHIDEGGNCTNSKKPKKERMRVLTKEQLDQFLSSICEPMEMSNELLTSPKGCKNTQCIDADWSTHIDVPEGDICVSYKNKFVSIVRTLQSGDDKAPAKFELFLHHIEADWLIHVLCIALTLNNNEKE